ncbi:general secretion pathway protein L [Gibbsiella quercinecans]|uniref:type II secretion system protein GspL n=1 Tax=Gibbsiella quercinecans TaxID=929813 RepID=UPI0010D19D5F|nr:type II secretion system protein GspL [Gibbsiella quercinecans]TCT88965.1 general secretion pathway protein L [Gibbsiella quercinecans]
MIKQNKADGKLRLVVRLAHDEQGEIGWLLWSDATARAVARGQGSLASVRAALAPYAAVNPAQVLVPATGIAFHQVSLSRRARRQQEQVIPFMLEDQLAADIEQLHFAVLEWRGEQAAVAVAAKALMRQWMAQCAELGIGVARLVPDVLALPLHDEGWSALREQDVWLFRQSRCRGMAAETSWLPALLNACAPLPPVCCYGDPPDYGLEWRQQPVADVLTLAAMGGNLPAVDLRQGEFAAPTPWRQGRATWRRIALASVCYLGLLATDAAWTHYQHYQQANYWRQESVRIYRQLFPAENNVVNPRVQMQQHLQRLTDDGHASPLAQQLAQLQRLMSRNAGVALQMLAYDGSRGEWRLDLRAAGYQELEQLQRQAAAAYQVTPGEMRQNSGGVEGRLVLRIKQ